MLISRPPETLDRRPALPLGPARLPWATRLRRGEGPIWGQLKRLALACLKCHVPVVGPVRPLARLAYRGHVAVREGWIWAWRFFYCEPLFRGQCEAVGPGLRVERLPYMVGRGRLRVGAGVRLSGRSSFAFGNRHLADPEIVLGDGTFVGHDCVLRASRSVVVGRHCLLAGGVILSDFDGHPVDAARRRLGEPTPADQVRPITLGDDVWVGQGAIILQGVRVGDRSIVGAGAVVTRDVPADSVVAGNPARIVKHLDHGSASHD